MSRYLGFATFPLLGLLAAAALVALATVGGAQRAHAQQDPLGLECKDIGQAAPQIACISLDPETDTNTVGDSHTVTATMTADDGQTPLEGIDLYIFVIKGPNAGERVRGFTDGSGQVVLTYTGDGGAGTDQMGTEACFQGCGNVDPYIDGCVANPDPCVDTFFNDPTCDGDIDDEYVCDFATKDWVDPTPTPTAAPTATPTPTPTSAPAQLPTTGGDGPGDGIATLPWLAAIVGVLVMAAVSGLWFAYRTRRVR